MNDFEICQYCENYIDLMNNIYYDYIFDETDGEVLFFCTVACCHLWVFGDNSDSDTETDLK